MTFSKCYFPIKRMAPGETLSSTVSGQKMYKVILEHSVLSTERQEDPRLKIS